MSAQSGRCPAGPVEGSGFCSTTTVGLRVGCSSSSRADGPTARVPSPPTPRPANPARVIPPNRPAGAPSESVGTASTPVLGSAWTASLTSGAAIAQQCGTDNAPTSAAWPTSATGAAGQRGRGGARRRHGCHGADGVALCGRRGRLVIFALSVGAGPGPGRVRDRNGQVSDADVRDEQVERTHVQEIAGPATSPGSARRLPNDTEPPRNSIPLPGHPTRWRRPTSSPTRTRIHPTRVDVRRQKPEIHCSHPSQ